MEHSNQSASVVYESINEGLEALCGSAASSVVFSLEQSGAFKSKRKFEIKNLETFSNGLECIFGFGSKVIERKILEILLSKLKVPRPPEVPKEFEFSEEVKKVFTLYKVSQKGTKSKIAQLHFKCNTTQKQCRSNR